MKPMDSLFCDKNFLKYWYIDIKYKESYLNKSFKKLFGFDFFKSDAVTSLLNKLLSFERPIYNSSLQIW